MRRRKVRSEFTLGIEFILKVADGWYWNPDLSAANYS
jgi:hypothetical protein